MIIPALANTKEYSAIEEMFESIRGIDSVRIEPIIRSIVIQYNSSELTHKHVLRYISLFFQQTNIDPYREIPERENLRKDLFRSLVSGCLLLAAFLRGNIGGRPDAFDYLVVISTSYTVLSHGENKLSHPDVITGIISMLSLGAQNILQVAAVTWIVNLIEVFNDLRRSKQLLYQ